MNDDELLLIIKQYAHGVNIDELQSALAHSVAKRTLQRRLQRLVQSGQVQRLGKGRSIVYILPQGDRSSIATTTVIYSPAAMQLKQRLHNSLSTRKRVGYHREFLYDYQPNVDYYLSQTLRTHLALIGRQEDGELAAGTFARVILNRLLIDLSWNSSRLEGNTYSLLETQRLLILGEVSSKRSSLETQMILNHKAAIEFLVDLGEMLDVTRYTVLNLHALLAENLIHNPEAIGRIRKIPVAIGKTSYQPLNIPQQLEENFNYILETAVKIQDPFEQAFFLMVQLPYLQAFEDVNKRVSRLAANIPFIKQNYCPLSFVELADRDYIDGIVGIYELNDISAFRDMFVWSYERSVGRYTSIRDGVVAPDPFKLRYRDDMIALVSAIVVQNVQARDVFAFIDTWLKQHIPALDHVRFKEIVELELMNLRESNIARYRITREAFQRWYQHWQV